MKKINSSYSTKMIFDKNNKLRNQVKVNELGSFHCENYPAVLRFDINGVKRSEEYYENGTRHNAKGPAVVTYNEKGEKVHEEYWLKGVLTNKEAAIVNYEKNIKTNESYYKNNLYIKGRIGDETPAFVEYDLEGNKKTEIFFDLPDNGLRITRKREYKDGSFTERIVNHYEQEVIKDISEKEKRV